MNEATHGKGVAIDMVEHQGIGKQVEVEAELKEQGETQGLDIPARIFGNRAEQLFDQNESDHRFGQPEKYQAALPLIRLDPARQQAELQHDSGTNQQPAEIGQPRRHRRFSGTAVGRQGEECKQEGVPHAVTAHIEHAGGNDGQRAGCPHGKPRQARPQHRQPGRDDDAPCPQAGSPAAAERHQIAGQENITQGGEGETPRDQRGVRTAHEVAGFTVLIGRESYCAPLPVSTTPMVSNRITMSSSKE